MVDGNGRRFVDEAQNYGDVGRAMRAARRRTARDRPLRSGWSSTPPIDVAIRSGPSSPVPDGGQPTRRGWSAPTTSTRWREMIGMESGTLADTVTRFNAGAAVGSDPDFGRGSFPYDRWIGDPQRPPPDVGTAVRGPLLRARSPSRLHGDQRWPPYRRSGSGVDVEGRGGRRALRGGQRRGQPLRDRHRRGRSHARARPSCSGSGPARPPRGTGDPDRSPVTGPGSCRSSSTTTPGRSLPCSGPWATPSRPRRRSPGPGTPVGPSTTSSVEKVWATCLADGLS